MQDNGPSLPVRLEVWGAAAGDGARAQHTHGEPAAYAASATPVEAVLFTQASIAHTQPDQFIESSWQFYWTVTKKLSEVRLYTEHMRPSWTFIYDLFSKPGYAQRSSPASEQD
ncbi:hypothetical protein A0H81_02456 [Grifola frondosa]|uniref:Uncharacterized protein n=1 Tax=Grifola frondosa TaxID=5627 RepID=A0A1C7MP94_GRIFR|nr:hypothetical protein A0H81_02456 [Grifola frondosa]